MFTLLPFLCLQLSEDLRLTAGVYEEDFVEEQLAGGRVVHVHLVPHPLLDTLEPLAPPGEDRVRVLALVLLHVLDVVIALAQMRSQPEDELPLMLFFR